MKHQVLVGTIGPLRALLRVTITDHRNVTGRLTIENNDEQAVAGYLVSHGGLAIRMSDGSTMTGEFDGHTFSGNVMRNQITIATFSLSRLIDMRREKTTHRCHLIGSLGTFAASLDLAMTDGRLLDGQLTVDGRRFAIVQGILEAGHLTLEFVDRAGDSSSSQFVPRLAGTFDGRTFSGTFVTYDPRGSSKKMVISFEFVAAPHSDEDSGIQAPLHARSE